MIFKCKTILIFYCCFIFFNIALATSVDNLETTTLKITSDNLTIQQDKSTAIFTGMVTIIFKDLKLITSKITVSYDNIGGNREIKNIAIPNKLKAIRYCENEIIIADHGSFNNLTKKLTLEGNVYLQKEGNILIADKLIYSNSL